MIEKQCAKCKVVKSIHEFNKVENTRDNKQCSCREGDNERRKIWQKNRRDRYLANKRIYQNDRYGNDVGFKLTAKLTNRLKKGFIPSINI